VGVHLLGRQVAQHLQNAHQEPVNKAARTFVRHGGHDVTATLAVETLPRPLECSGGLTLTSTESPTLKSGMPFSRWSARPFSSSSCFNCCRSEEALQGGTSWMHFAVPFSPI
jgi:hypothetical protein